MWYILAWTYSQKVFYVHMEQVLPLLQCCKQRIGYDISPCQPGNASFSQIKAEPLSWDPIKLPHKTMGDRQGLYYVCSVITKLSGM